MGNSELPRNVILTGDVRPLLATLPDESVHMVCTSPPYWSMRDYGIDGQLGLEPTVEEYVANLVEIFADVHRVLRKDGTLWLNLGDCYVRGRSGPSGGKSTLQGTRHSQDESKRARESFRRARRDVGDVRHKAVAGRKPKDLVGQPWRVALALQAWGWWLRRDIIWHKPNPAPESVRDRPTSAHEYLFLFAKAKRYFYDQEAIRERVTGGGHSRGKALNPKAVAAPRQVRAKASFALSTKGMVSTRNKRSVWTITPEASKAAHYATFPVKLVDPCILAGTSEGGVCSCCGAPYERVIEIDDPEGRLGKGYHDHTGDIVRGQRGIPYADGAPSRRTVGWRATCTHEAPAARAVVLDPFIGTGTTAVAAWKRGRDYIGIDISPEYVAIAEARLAPLKKQGRLL
jgi:DNA modification methylase